MSESKLSKYLQKTVVNVPAGPRLRTPVILSDSKGFSLRNCKLERDMTLCGDNWLYEEASLKKSGSSLLNSARKQ
jgi:hypothetical protein